MKVCNIFNSRVLLNAYIIQSLFFLFLWISCKYVPSIKLRVYFHMVLKYTLSDWITGGQLSVSVMHLQGVQLTHHCLDFVTCQLDKF